MYNRLAIYFHENMIYEKRMIIRYINYCTYILYIMTSAKNKIFIKLTFLVKKKTHLKTQNLSQIW